MEKLKNLSLKKTIILYVTTGLIFSFILSVIVYGMAEKIQIDIWKKYIDIESFYRMFPSDNRFNYVAEIPRVNNSIMTQTDIILSAICDFLETWLILLLPIISSIIAVFLFYRHKIKEPLMILTEASKKIGKSELDLEVSYHKADEMGRLCHEFEHMRQQLQCNNHEMWRVLEQEKNLRAAIAHDIRSPLAVLSGYQEMLLEFVSERSISENEIIEMLQQGRVQINRLEHFIDTMKQLTKLDELQVTYEEIKSEDFINQIRILFETLCSGKLNSWKIQDDIVWMTYEGDLSIMLEVCENLLSNALRYANEKIEVSLKNNDNMLEIVFSDDGCGFGKNIDRMTETYYHNRDMDEDEHFGLGLYLCKLYCEKHGGMLSLGDSELGGASAKACFQVKKSTKKG